MLEKYRRRIVEQFFPARGYGKVKLGEARKAIREYRKATGSVLGTAELLLTDVENAADFARSFGYMDTPFCNSVCSALSELEALIRDDAKEMYPRFEQRLAMVHQMADGIGWGFGDYVADVVLGLEEDFGEPD